MPEKSQVKWILGLHTDFYFIILYLNNFGRGISLKNNVDKTSELLTSLTTIHNKEEFEAYLITHTQTELSFSQYYNSILHCKNISLAEAVQNSSLERHYAYQIINGTKANPGRDKILCLCIAAHMDINETRRALEIGNCAILYPKNTRDAIIIQHINTEDFSVTNINEDLFIHHISPLLA